jgi:hypothetical protein
MPQYLVTRLLKQKLKGKNIFHEISFGATLIKLYGGAVCTAGSMVKLGMASHLDTTGGNPTPGMDNMAVLYC